MEQDKVVEAIYKLEITLTERICEQTVVMGVTNERLDNLRMAVDRHREILYGHDDGDRLGLVAEMGALTKKESERKWTMRAMTVSFFALLGNFFWDLFHA